MPKKANENLIGSLSANARPNRSETLSSLTTKSLSKVSSDVLLKYSIPYWISGFENAPCSFKETVPWTLKFGRYKNRSLRRSQHNAPKCLSSHKGKKRLCRLDEWKGDKTY